MKSTSQIFTLIGALGVAASPAAAADFIPQKQGFSSTEPLETIRAVSGLNGKLELGGGAIQGDGLGYGLASVSIPVTNAIGVQFDALAGSWNGDFVGGIAGHGFWRNPNVALAGIYSSYTYSDQRFGPVGVGGKKGIHVGRVGPELEFYFNRFSFETTFGLEGGDVRERLFTIADMAFYPIDNARISIGHRYIGGKHMAAGGVEYLTPYRIGTVAPALYAEGRAGEDNYRAVYGGVRFYFGDSKKSLINRHRQDDPHPRVPDELFAIDSAKKAKAYKFIPTSTGGNDTTCGECG